MTVGNDLHTDQTDGMLHVMNVVKENISTNLGTDMWNEWVRIIELLGSKTTLAQKFKLTAGETLEVVADIFYQLSEIAGGIGNKWVGEVLKEWK